MPSSFFCSPSPPHPSHCLHAVGTYLLNCNSASPVTRSVLAGCYLVPGMDTFFFTNISSVPAVPYNHKLVVFQTVVFVLESKCRRRVMLISVTHALNAFLSLAHHLVAAILLRMSSVSQFFLSLLTLQ